MWHWFMKESNCFIAAFVTLALLQDQVWKNLLYQFKKRENLTNVVSVMSALEKKEPEQTWGNNSQY